jgi:20S proteasome alpha/beta subunit
MLARQPHRRFYPFRIPKRLPERKKTAVTIAAGFRFDKGILLCADTQYSAGHKTEGTKIFPIPYGTARLVIALTGREAYARRAIEEIQRELQYVGVDELTKDNLQDAIEKALRTIFERNIFPHPHYGTFESPEFQFVIAMYSPIDGLSLLKSEEAVAFVIDDKICAGSGAYLGDYLNKRFYSAPNRPLNDAVALATYVLYEIKGHDIHCGGASEFAILWDTGEVSPVQTAKVVLNEDYAASFDEFSKKIFYAVADLERTDDEIFATMAKTDEVLFLSLITRREKQEQENLIKGLTKKLSDLA